MAQDDVQIRFTADINAIKAQITTLEKSIAGTQTAADKASKGMSESFNSSFKDIASGVAQAFSIAAIINFSKTAVQAFAEAEKGEQRLRVALGNNAAAYKILIKQAEELSKKIGIDDDVIINAQAYLAVQGRTTEQIKKTIEAATKLSAVTGEDLNSAVRRLDATFEGVTRGLNKLDSGFDDLSKEQLKNGGAIDLLNTKYAGFVDGTLDNTQTRIAKTRVFFGNLLEDVGSFFGTVISQAGVAIEIADKFLERFGIGKPDAAKVGESDGEAYFTGVEQAIQKADRKSFDKIAQGLIDAAETGLTKVDNQITAIREKQRNSNDQREKVALEGAIKLLTDTNLKGEQNRVNRVNGIIEAERARKKTLFKEQADEEAKIYEENAEKLKKIEEEKAKERKRLWDFSNEQFKQGFIKWNDDLANETKKSQAWKEANDSFKQGFLDFQKDLSEGNTKIADEQREKILAMISAGQDLLNSVFDFAGAQLNSELESLNTYSEAKNEAFDKEAEALERKNERGLLSDREYARQKEALDKKRAASDKKIADEEKKIKQKQAEQEKLSAIFSTIINTAVAVVKALADGGPILAAIVGAAGALQLATVVSTPIPKFKDGNPFVDDKNAPQGRDTILSWLDRGERVVTRENNKKHWDKYEALESGNFDKYVEKFYIQPQLALAKKEYEKRQSDGFAQNVADSMFLNFKGMTAYDADRIRRKGMEIKNSDELAVKIAEKIADKLPKYYGRI